MDQTEIYIDAFIFEKESSFTFFVVLVGDTVLSSRRKTLWDLRIVEHNGRSGSFRK
jgi:hypothetical protein